MKEIEILLVEDDPDDAELTLHSLNSNSKIMTRKLWHSKDGAEALEFIFGDKSDLEVKANLKLIILDLKLPKINGLEVLRAIRQDQRTWLIPVIMLTSSKEKRDVEEAYDLGVNSYIVKPLSFEVYVQTVSMLGDYWMNMNQHLF